MTRRTLLGRLLGATCVALMARLPDLSGFGGRGLFRRQCPNVWVYSHHPVANPDGSRERPFATLAQALACARPGDTIGIRAGHTEQVDSPLLVNASTPGLTIIGLAKPQDRPRLIARNLPEVMRIEASDTHVENLHFKNTLGYAIRADGLLTGRIAGVFSG